MFIDEQMIPFSGRCEYRQYVPAKPNPLGLKNFVLAARDGLVLDFEIYVDKSTISQDIMKDLGLGAGIVQVLCRTIENSCVLYTDRFFTSLKPVVSKLKTDKDVERGQWDKKVRSDDKVCVLKWKDTKAVTMLSTCAGGAPVDTCKRWCKVQKKN